MEAVGIKAEADKVSHSGEGSTWPWPRSFPRETFVLQGQLVKEIRHPAPTLARGFPLLLFLLFLLLQLVLIDAVMELGLEMPQAGGVDNSVVGNYLRHRM